MTDVKMPSINPSLYKSLPTRQAWGVQIGYRNLLSGLMDEFGFPKSRFIFGEKQTCVSKEELKVLRKAACSSINFERILEQIQKEPIIENNRVYELLYESNVFRQTKVLVKMAGVVCTFLTSLRMDPQNNKVDCDLSPIRLLTYADAIGIIAGLPRNMKKILAEQFDIKELLNSSKVSSRCRKNPSLKFLENVVDLDGSTAFIAVNQTFNDEDIKKRFPKFWDKVMAQFEREFDCANFPSTIEAYKKENPGLYQFFSGESATYRNKMTTEKLVVEYNLWHNSGLLQCYDVTLLERFYGIEQDKKKLANEMGRIQHPSHEIGAEFEEIRQRFYSYTARTIRSFIEDERLTRILIYDDSVDESYFQFVDDCMFDTRISLAADIK